MRTHDAGARDTTLALTAVGDGAPIVFLHAFPLDARMWAPQLSALPTGWRGIAPDLRGFGRSPDRGRPARHVGDHAHDVLALTESLQAGPVVLAGLSMGGYIAFECWRRRPAAVRALVLADTRAEADTDEARAKRVKMQALARASGTTAVIDAMLPNLLGATTQTGDPHLALEVRGWASASSSGLVDALEMLRTRPDSRPTLATITCPALVIVGREDTLTPPEAAQLMRDGIAGAQYVEIAEAGHLANVEQPEAFNAALHAFLAGL